MNQFLLALLVFLCAVAPAWSAPSPGSKPAGSSWVGVAPADLPFVTRAALLGVEAGEVPQAQARELLQGLLKTPAQAGSYEAAAQARALAEGAAALAKAEPSLAEQCSTTAGQLLDPIQGWLEDYGKFHKVHGFDEPLWVRGRPEVLAQAILAWVALEEVSSSAPRREAIRRSAEGIQRLLRGDFSRYPFGAHLSSVTSEGRPRTYVSPATGNPVAGLSWVVERNYTACALARAGRLLQEPSLLASAEREGLGVLAHLAVSGAIPYDFAPRPELEVLPPQAAAALVENLAVLAQVLDKPVFRALTGLAATRVDPSGEAPLAQASRLVARRFVGQAGAGRWTGAGDVRPPFTYQVVEVEDGKAVEKALEAVPIRYPGGTPGHLAVVGRENMFWMRFDVDREDEYFFHLSFLKSEVSGGLVSVLMRIDGDQIFRVNLGGATDDPFVDVDLVSGPRTLRHGPHSFGIRFSGLLMKQPAVLDSVFVQPAVERRWLALKDGKGVLAMKCLSDQPVRVRMQELEGEGSPSWLLLSGMGNSVPPKLSTDRRGRVWLEMPPGGVGFLEWSGPIPGVEESDLEAKP